MFFFLINRSKIWSIPGWNPDLAPCITVIWCCHLYLMCCFQLDLGQWHGWPLYSQHRRKCIQWKLRRKNKSSKIRFKKKKLWYVLLMLHYNEWSYEGGFKSIPMITVLKQTDKKTTRMLQYQKICLNRLSAHKIDTLNSAITVQLQSSPYILRVPPTVSFGSNQTNEQKNITFSDQEESVCLYSWKTVQLVKKTKTKLYTNAESHLDI